MIYAFYDTTVSKNNPGHGFANSKQYAAFSTKAKLDTFLAGRASFDFTARRVTRSDAMKNLETNGGPDKGLYLDPVAGNLHEAEFIVLRASRW